MVEITHSHQFVTPVLFYSLNRLQNSISWSFSIWSDLNFLHIRNFTFKQVYRNNVEKHFGLHHGRELAYQAGFNQLSLCLFEKCTWPLIQIIYLQSKNVSWTSLQFSYLRKKKKAKTFSFKLNNQNSTWWGDLTNFNVITYSVHITVFPISNDISKILKGFFFFKGTK